MKNVTTILSGFVIILLFSFSQCKKNKNDEPQLPPETTTGAMTFGCKINGQVFVPRDGRGRPGLYCQYVNLGTGPGGGWYLSIPAIDQVPENSIGITIVTDSLLVLEGMQYKFGTSKGFAKARYYIGLDNYPKDVNDDGTLFIKKHDQLNRILSGTFSFIGTNVNGVKVNVTEGRFDIRY
jgi:hypothetical protein